MVEKTPEGAVEQVIPDQPLKLPTPVTDPRAAAQAHAPGVAATFKADTVGKLLVDKVLSVGKGSTVRLKQYIDDVPVYGASVAQSLAEDGSLLSVTGATTESKNGSYQGNPNAGVQRAASSAIAAVAAQYGVNAADLKAVNSSAAWYDGTLVGLEGQSGAVPAYQVDITTNSPKAWTAFVSASDFALLDSWSQEKAALDRVVCDANSTKVSDSADTNCGKTSAFKPARSEGQAPSTVADVNTVYQFFGETQAFYAAYTGVSDLSDFIGVDTGDGLGKALRGTVRLCSNTECPWANAYWSTDHMAFGEGVTTDDVTGHELTHGVTQHTSNLVYRSQSGAINESLSDTFGEFLDLTNGSPDDTPANRWKIGEGSSLGVIRDMANPPAYQDPDSMTSQYYYRGTNQSAYVHINSGVGNKLAYLITDGGTFNNRTVTPLGIAKAAALYWTVETLLPSNATYKTLGNTLSTACNQNVQNKVAGTTSADCSSVVQATYAVGIVTPT